MGGNQENQLRRRAVLSAIGATTGGCTLHTVSATEDGHAPAHDGEVNHRANYVKVDSTSLGSVEPVAVVPRSVSSYSENEQRAISTAATEGRATLVGEPTFPIGSIMATNDGYYEISLDRVSLSEETVPTLAAERVEYRTMSDQESTTLDSFDEAAAGPVQLAIGKARHQAARAGRVDDQRLNGPPYVFNPNERVPKALRAKNRSFIVEDKGEYYRLSYEKRRVPVPVFDVEADEVANAPESFNEWFSEEYLSVDAGVKALSLGEQQLISTATSDEYTEEAPYSTDLKSLLDRMNVDERSSSKSNRYLRLNGELHYVEISQTVGC